MTTSNKDLISRTLAARMMACIAEYKLIKRKESKLFKQLNNFVNFTGFLIKILWKSTTGINKIHVNIPYYRKNETQNTKSDEQT